MKKFISLMLVCAMISSCATSRVNINTNVPASNVIIDGKEVGETPISSLALKNKTGRYQIIIEKEGYKVYQGYLRKETKAGPLVAVVTGYSLIWLLLPALLLLYIPYVEGPEPNQYFVLEKEGA